MHRMRDRGMWEIEYMKCLFGKTKNLVISSMRMDDSGSRLTQVKVWALGVSTMLLLLWAGIVQLTTMGESLGSIAFKYKSFYSFPPKRVYANRGFLMVSSNGGLNQMRSGICDMVVIARYMNVTLVVPELDRNSFWNDKSKFQDIFDVDYFINSLRDEVLIIKNLPFWLKRKLSRHGIHSMAPVSWSNISYYYNTVLPRIETYGLVHLAKTDARLANNGLPKEVQKLRCRVNYEALRFTTPIEELGKKIVCFLRQNGPFMVLHLRYEKDMLAFSGCTQGCSHHQAEELKHLRYNISWWKEKEIDEIGKRQAGLCPLTPEETTLVLRAFDFTPDMQIYIAAGDIYGGETRLGALRNFYPNLVKKETLLSASDLEPFQNHSNQMAALDYFVSLASDIFVMTYQGHMAKLVEGHRRYLGYKMTINVDQKVVVKLIDEYINGTRKWNEFTRAMKLGHVNRMGGPAERFKVPGKPKLEDYFYTNPQECLSQIKN